MRKRERGETIAKIKEAIAAYELSAEDLGLMVDAPIRRGRNAGNKSADTGAPSVDRRRGRPAKKTIVEVIQRGRKTSRKSTNKQANADKRSVVAAKYRDVTTGATWTGRGKQPRWLAAALKGDKKLEDFKI